MLRRRDDGYELDTDPRRLDVARVHDWISNDSYWAQGRSAEVMRRAIEGSLCFGVYAPDGGQVWWKIAGLLTACVLAARRSVGASPNQRKIQQRRFAVLVLACPPSPDLAHQQ